MCVVRRCWHEDPRARPSAEVLVHTLNGFLTASLRSMTARTGTKRLSQRMSNLSTASSNIFATMPTPAPHSPALSSHVYLQNSPGTPAHAGPMSRPASATSLANHGLANYAMQKHGMEAPQQNVELGSMDQTSAPSSTSFPLHIL